MARLFCPDGNVLDIEPPANGIGYTLDEVKVALAIPHDRLIQQLPLGGGEVLLMDEEAKLRPPVPALNINASSFAHAHGALLADDHIVGNALHVACRDGEWVQVITTKETSE